MMQDESIAALMEFDGLVPQGKSLISDGFSRPRAQKLYQYDKNNAPEAIADLSSGSCLVLQRLGHVLLQYAKYNNSEYWFNLVSGSAQFYSS